MGSKTAHSGVHQWGRPETADRHQDRKVCLGSGLLSRGDGFSGR